LDYGVQLTFDGVAESTKSALEGFKAERNESVRTHLNKDGGSASSLRTFKRSWDEFEYDETAAGVRPRKIAQNR